MDKDSSLDQSAAYCTGDFSAYAEPGDFFVGVARHEGWSSDMIVGWGRSLCGQGTDASTEYDVEFVVDGA